jgi:arabinose-5-phosphate isomerase
MSIEAIFNSEAAERSLIVDTVQNAVDLQLDAINSLRRALTGPLMEEVRKAVELILSAKGRVIVTGIGKSGIVGRKIAATLASTGTPAYFMHATEGSHGDLGMVTEADVILALSWSGETAELFDVLFYSRRLNISMIAITAGTSSTLARKADIVIALPRVREVCQHGLAPSSSTLLQAAVGDAIAIAVSERRGFQVGDFQQRHPGGKLGSMLQCVADIMGRTPAIPLVEKDATMDGVMLTMTGSRYGAVGVTDKAGKLVGSVSEVELGMHMATGLFERTAGEVMGPPHIVAGEQRVSEAVEYMSEAKTSVVFVVGDSGAPSGILSIHDALSRT